MTYLSGKLILRPGTHRVYSQLQTIVTVNACIVRAIATTFHLKRDFVVGSRNWAEGEFTRMQSAQFPCEVRLPMFGPVELMVKGVEPTSILIGIEPAIAAIPTTQKIALVDSKGALENVVIAVFSEFFENHVEWLKANVNGDKSKWPTLWRFALLVRNAIAHGGTINWLNPNADAVSWYTLTYTAADKGKKIICTDLSLADVIILMLELSDSLDALGCPL